MKQKGNEWVDGTGKTIPKYAISPVLKIEEVHSHKIVDAALKAEKALNQLFELQKKAYNEVYDAKVADANMKGNKTNFGGMTINSFDNTVEVKITKPNNVYFDNTYTELVKEKFDEYFNSLKTDDDTSIFLRDLLNDLLYTTGGKLDQGKVSKLRKYRARISENKKLSVSAKLFIEAVDLFDKAIKEKPGSTGLYISLMDDDKGKMRRVAINYTDI